MKLTKQVEKLLKAKEWRVFTVEKDWIRVDPFPSPRPHPTGLLSIEVINTEYARDGLEWVKSLFYMAEMATRKKNTDAKLGISTFGFTGRNISCGQKKTQGEI